MSQIPDLNTSNISFFGYYEVPDSEIKSGESFDPTELKFSTPRGYRYSTHSAKPYDNGYKFKIEDRKMNSTITLRAGNDDHKWITTHIKDYSSKNGGIFSATGTDLDTYYTKKDEDDIGGQYDVMPWKDWHGRFEPTENSLFSAIKRSLNSTDFWTNSQDDWKDSQLKIENTGLYDYSVGGDHEISIFTSRGSDGPCSIAFTPTTTIHKAYAVGRSNSSGTTIWINETGLPSYYVFAFDITDFLVNDKEFKIDYQSNSNFYIIVVWS